MDNDREEAYRELVEYLIRNSGLAPTIDSSGLWVDLFDEITNNMEEL